MENSTTELRRLLTRQEAAEFLRVKPLTLWRWRKKGYGPRACKVGGKVLYDREALEDFLRAARHVPA